MSLPIPMAAAAPPVNTRLYAVAVGVTVLGLYASQPLVSDLAASLGLGAWANAVTAITLAGYSAGLFLLVPLVDVLDARKLIGGTLACQVIALAAAALARHAPVFLGASFMLGLTSTAIQMLVPTVASLVPQAQRGRVVGDVMSGLMAGILLSRPLASLVAGTFGWRNYYALEAAATAIVGILVVPRIRGGKPASAGRYPALIASMFTLVLQEPVLRLRALYQALLAAAFNVFWTSVALLLASDRFGLGHTGIALFALAGASGAFIAPVAGRLGDRGLDRPATLAMHAIAVAAMVIAWIAASAGWARPVGLALLVLSAALLDLGVIGDQALGRRAVNLLNAQARGRLNGLFTGLFFVGSAAGALVTGPAWAHWGWAGVSGTALAFALAAFVLHLLQGRADRAAHRA